MITISLCMIVRDEEAVLARCLACVRGIADEIIMIDTGSTDRTREIAREHGAKVYDLPWTDDFAAARNASFERATMEYILWLDADDVIDPENQALFMRLKHTLDPEADIVMMRYHVAFDAVGKPTYTFFRERLLRRACGFRWHGRVHEAINPRGKVIQSQIAIRHEKLRQGDPRRNLRIYEKMLADGIPLEPRHRYYYARELFANGCDDQAIALLHQCVDDPCAWVENRIGACRDLSGCYRRKGDTEGALKALLQSFALGEPRAETCCEIGSIFLQRGQYAPAIFWYRAAPECTPSEASGGFGLPDCRDYIPFLQLCVCYDSLGEYELAEHYNEKAGAVKENDPSVLANRKYFAERRMLAEEKG